MLTIIKKQTNPNIQELKRFIDEAFSVTDPEADKKWEEEGSGQSVDEWFSVEEMVKYFENGELLEAKNEQNELMGIAFVGKENLITWPDGKKAELFVLAVSPKYRNQGIGKALLQKAEEDAKILGAKNMIINAHVFEEQVHNFYERQGYQVMGVLKGYYDNGDAKFFIKELI